MKIGIIASLLGLAATSLYAGNITLTFEGLTNGEAIGNYYAADGITFESGEAVVSTAAGGTGNFGGNPSGVTVATTTVTPMTVDVSGGFTSLSFWYSEPGTSPNSTVSVYDQSQGGNGSGNLLYSTTLADTPVQDAGGNPGNCMGYTNSNPGAYYCPFELVTITAADIDQSGPTTGVGYSVDFGGSPGFIGYDDISFNLCDPSQPNCPQNQPGTPEPSTWLLFGTGALLMMFGARRMKSVRS